MPKLLDNALPWQRLMEVAFGVLHISPPVFWSMTPFEWMAAFKGWKEAHGLLPAGEEMGIRRDVEKMMRQFPDAIAP